jgi:PAS domain S-box-containing protein
MGIVEKHEDIRILTIEDEDLIREYVCDYLEDMGFLTLQASNGREGVEKIRTEKPDLVLTDLRMPEMNGLDVLSIMQNEFSSIPVIVISGTGSLSDVIQSLKFGAWDYILKPIHDYSILELSVNRVLERKRLIDENARYREHLEEEVVKRTLELEKSIQKFKMLFNLAGDAIFIHEPDGKIIDMNEQAVLYLGFTREQLSNMKMEELFTKSDAIDFKHEMEKLLDKQKIMYETVHKNSRGEFVPVEVNACLITMEQSPVILSVCRDISERKKAEEEKKKLEKQIVTAQKMECMGMLASGIAHDFNNMAL